MYTSVFTHRNSTTVSDRRRDGHSLQKRHAQTVAERNTMTASPEDLAEYDIEEETSAAPEIAESVASMNIPLVTISVNRIYSMII
ncbi:hypothetical protein BV898_18207 [Hypsibius exemplaris]|uniref:Uncharacterized protein n=1 Tax=Hypsibius exemplaris TaxID=2072580 RepID=A0A9X6NNN3_HYPEX|nr:hypothetical protein BV898_18207 [Hypsibius exemplaris]